MTEPADVSAVRSDDGHRYRTIAAAQGRRIELRDDGYRIDLRLPDAGKDYARNVDPNEWILWGEYKNCEITGVGRAVADLLMTGAIAEGRHIELKDDGYRVEFRLGQDDPDSRGDIAPDEWLIWASYKQCDLPGPGRAVADFLMASAPAERRPAP